MSVVRVSAQPNLNNLYHWKHPPEASPYSYNVPLWCPVITHHAPALIFQPSEGERVLRGLGQSPIQAHMVQISVEKFGGPREKMYLCTREPDSPTNRPGMSTPREDLAQRCSADSLRPTSMGFFSCLHTHTRAHALDTYQLTAAVWNIDTCLSEYRHQPIIYRRLSISEGRIIDTSL